MNNNPLTGNALVRELDKGAAAQLLAKLLPHSGILVLSPTINSQR